MRILQIHNNHSVEGGSEVMFRATISLLRGAGHEVFTYERHNREISGTSARVRAAVSGVYSHAARRDVTRILKDVRPDVAHVHNLYPLISPSVLDACEAARVPVVMRLPDFTLLCPTSHHFRAGSTCERCLGGREYHCLLTNCRGNLLMSAAYAARTMAARVRRCFPEKVSAFAAPTEFVRRRFVAAGFPAERIKVIPNPVPIPAEPATPARGGYVAYIGRISSEKGVRVLLNAARATGLPVRIAGEGREESAEPAPANVSFVGRLARGGELEAFLDGARFVVVPSLCFESFNLVCAEAMAHGLPVIASRIGGLPELVEHERTGLLFEAGDSASLGEHMLRLWHEPAMLGAMGEAARRKAAEEYSREAHYRRLAEIYRAVIESRRVGKEEEASTLTTRR